MYAVVEFPEEEGVETIPLRWLTENEKECYWPQFKNIPKTICQSMQQLPRQKTSISFPSEYSENSVLVHVTGKS